jgi:hypothetical protein
LGSKIDIFGSMQLETDFDAAGDESPTAHLRHEAFDDCPVPSEYVFGGHGIEDIVATGQ